MVKVSEIKADLETLKASVSKAGATDPLLMGVMVNRQRELCTLTTFDGISATTLTGRNWGLSIPEGGFVLPGGFANIFKMLNKDAEVQISKVKTGQIEIKQGSSKWCFPMSLNTSGFYPMGEDIIKGQVESISVTLDGDLMKEAIASVFYSIGKESTNFCCAEFVLNVKDSELIAVATDIRRATLWKAVNVKFPTLPLPEYRILIPGQKLLALGRFVKDCADVQVSFTNSVIVFENTALKTSLSIRLLSGEGYPPVKSLFEIPPTAGYTIEPKELISAIKRAKILLPDNKFAQDNSLILTFENENIRISHECDLFVENVSYKPLPIEGIQQPELFDIALNIDYLLAALSPLTGKNCDLKIQEKSAAMISSETLGGSVTHFIALVHKKNKQENQNG